MVGGSFFEPVPDHGDAYPMKAILHDWNDDDAARIFSNIRAAIAPDGKLLLLESVLPERASSDMGIAMLIDLEMLVVVGGRERTRAEWANLLGRAGFRLDRVIHTATPVSIIEAAPPEPSQRFRSRTLYVEGHDSRVSSPTSGTPLAPTLTS